MRQVDLIAAVVDGIPFPRNTASARSPELESVVKDCSAEGISVLLTDSESATSDLWPAQPRKLRCPTIGTVTFQFEARLDDVECTTQATDPPKQAWQSFQLPLANTLFQNGRTSTLLAQRWIRSTASATDSEMLQVRNTRMLKQILHINRFPRSSHVIIPELPLSAITYPRAIAASGGNVIKAFKNPNGSRQGLSVPASAELEERVSMWNESQNLPGQRVMLWALVTPREFHLDHRRLTSMSLQSALSSGSRLFKVISGGGGWGAKKGLLALDPEIEYRKYHGESKSIFDFDNNIDFAQQSAFRDVARPGDVVTFYVYDRVNGSRSRAQQNPSPNLRESTTKTSITFETIPSELETRSALKVSDVGIYPWYVENHFGMASESMVLTIYRDDEGCASQRHSAQGHTIVRTKIDVPYTHCSIESEASCPTVWRSSNRVQLSTN